MINNRIIIIDVLRALAVTLVLLFHFFSETFDFGYIGVDIFLVISGFVIAKSLNSLRGNYKWKTFFIKRLFRLFPVLLFVVTITLAFFLILYPESLQNLLLQSFTSSLSAISNLYFGSISGYFDIVSEVNPFLHTWSLSLEWQFYIIITLIIAFFSIKKSRIVVLILTIISIILMVQYKDSRPILNFYSFFTRFFEFGVGFLAYSYSGKIKSIKLVRFFLFSSLILIYFLNGFDSSSWPNVYSLCLVFIIVYSILNDLQFKISNSIIQKTILWISDRSYSIYLIHFPFAAYYRYLNIKPIDSISTVFVFIIILILSDLSFRFIENKFRFNYKNPKSSLALFILPFFLILFLFISNNSKSAYKDIYGDYVAKTFNSLKLVDSNTDKDVFIVGDSFAQDFVNILSDGLSVEQTRISTSYIDMNCGNLFVNFSKLTKHVPSSLNSSCENEETYRNILSNIENKDILVLASNWTDWSLSFLEESIINIQKSFSGKILIVGTKHIGKQSPFHINNLNIENKIKLRSTPPSYVNIINNKLIEIVSKFNATKIQFLNIQSLMLDDNSKGIVCDKNGNLISYDGGHLTLLGSKFIGELLPESVKIIFNDTN